MAKGHSMKEGLRMPADHDSNQLRDISDIPFVDRWRRNLAVRRELRDVAVVTHVKGDIDMATAPVLDARLCAAERIATPAAPLVVDLTQVDFMDATGLRVLVEHHQRCAENRVVFVIVASHRAVLRPMQITTLDRYLLLYPSLATAVAAELS